ncbi:O-methyltransferase [Pontibacter arcticus]|uniref:SAM-dependent methyltransferase n=1 Tax=Pontibacter arcticus TaxID=2080288 RepID=A0A364RFJ2_9BACT|nr:class I SAM-dependent methyltransferase [Pontibacter arcticus]RAU83025.1 SAM-dependent methyltransferase [Pontibacter arcticus]
MSVFSQAFDYLQYRLRALKLHGVHSPFIFQLYQNVILDKEKYESYTSVEALRKELLQDKRKINVTDFGAGSKVTNQRERSINEIARNSAKPAKYSQLLYRLVQHFKPNTVFELGTSLGITTSYLAKANSEVNIYTFEGCPAIAQTAKANFEQLNLANINQVIGNLDHTLAKQLQPIKQLDFVFFDGNHRYEPTMRYFEACLTRHHEDSVFVMDDIYWSDEMKQAWESIKQHPQVRQTVDLYFIGLVFFRTTQPKEHFTLAY